MLLIVIMLKNIDTWGFIYIIELILLSMLIFFLRTYRYIKCIEKLNEQVEIHIKTTDIVKEATISTS